MEKIMDLVERLVAALEERNEIFHRQVDLYEKQTHKFLGGTPTAEDTDKGGEAPPESESTNAEPATSEPNREELLAECARRGIEVKSGVRTTTLMKMLENAPDVTTPEEAIATPMEEETPAAPAEYTAQSAREAIAAIYDQSKAQRDLLVAAINSVGASKFDDVAVENLGKVVDYFTNGVAKLNSETGEDF